MPVLEGMRWWKVRLPAGGKGLSRSAAIVKQMVGKLVEEISENASPCPSLEAKRS